MNIPPTRIPNHAERLRNALKMAPGEGFFSFFLAMIQADFLFWVDKPKKWSILKRRSVKRK